MSLHLKCSHVTKKQCQLCQKSKSLSSRIYCTDYSCLKCGKHILDDMDSVCCDMCNKWIHRTCAKISKIENQNVEKYTSKKEVWLCNPCLNFPLSSLTDEKLHLLFVSKSELSSSSDRNRYKTSSSVCSRKLGKPLKGIPCNTCNSLVYRRCTGSNTSKISQISENKSWKCLCCPNDEFVFSLVDDNDLQRESFNLNFDCSCLTNKPSRVDKSKYVFQYTPINTNGDRKTSLADMDDMIG